MASTPKRGDLVELTIQSLDEKGQGVASLGSYTVRVRGGLPGDRIVARMGRIRHRRLQADAKAEERVQQEVERITAPCSHFGTCGGCVWQDVMYEKQVEFKREIVSQSLKEAGLEIQLEKPILTQDPFSYRNKMEFSFGQSEDGRVDLGLHSPGRFDRIFDLESCHLQSEISNQIVRMVREWVRERGLQAYHLYRHTGLLRFLTLREGKRTGEVMVVLTTSGDEFPDALELGQEIVTSFPEVKSVVHSINRRKAQIAIGEEEVLLAGKPEIRERLGKFEFDISPSSFFQTNSVQAERLYLQAAEFAEAQPNDQVLDVYCGTGGLSLFMSQIAGSVTGIELAESSIQDANRNAASNQVENCNFIPGAAEDVLGELGEQGKVFDVAITDPPRSGMHKSALRALIGLAPNRIVYVSCNPKAMGNDLKGLCEGGYRIDRVQLVDMFPHTPHCEVVSRLTYSR